MNEHADRRAFTYAVGASLALHAVLLALRAPEPEAPLSPSAAPIVAHLAEPEALKEAPPPAVEPPKPPPKRAVPKPAPKVVRPVPAPQAPTFTMAPPPELPSEPAPPAPASEAPSPAPAQAPATVASAPAVPAAPAPDPSLLIAQYRQQFINAAVRYKRYPLRARDSGWEGDVVVRLEIAASGELAEVKVKRGSGYAVLDEQALEMFRLAAPQVPVPPTLRGRAFGFDVRTVYSLKD
ncbi:MAG TPA: TonB family protein [Burkholderiales bacterium]|nr:TonB family protein [Burkholderiales bacterium]